MKILIQALNNKIKAVSFIFQLARLGATLYLFFSSPAYADSSEFHDFENRRWILQEYTNELGEYEVSLSIKEERDFLPDTTQTVLIGRGINKVKSVDIWFIPSIDGINKIVKTPKKLRTNPWLAAQWILQTEMNLEDRWFAWIALEYIGRNVSMAMDHHHDFYETIKREEINLLDLEYRLELLRKKNPNDPSIKLSEDMLVEHWQAIRNRIHAEKTQDVWLFAAGDVAIAWFGGKLITTFGKWLGTVGTRLIEKYSLSQTELSKSLTSLVSRWGEKINDKVESLKNKFGRNKTVKTDDAVEAGERWSLTRLPIQNRVATYIQSMEARSKIARASIKVFGEVLTTLKSGLSEAKYVALTQSLQVAAELAARPEDLFDPNPIVMSNKMIHDRDFMQNFLYMSNETFWMAAIASRFQTSSFKKRLFLCGILGATDSQIMNLAIKGNMDHGRVVLDTGWESIIGNLQTQIDISSLKYFEGLAIRKSNPKLKFLGYAVALVDQGMGYFGYAKASHYYEHHFEELKKPTAPIPADPDTETNESIQLAQFKLIPILGESQ